MRFVGESNVGGLFEGVSAFRERIDKMIAGADAAARMAVVRGGHLIEGEAKKQFQGNHPKGQPHVGGSNPNTVTGTLRRSIKVGGIAKIGIGTWQSQTGPTVIYGRRIELGFQGADSLGRVYNNQPLPYLKPGLDAARPKLAGLF